MLNFNHLTVGTILELPELATHVPSEYSAFLVKGIFAGGMGLCIHLAHQNTTREFALKVVRPDFVADSVFLDRFFDELQVWIAASACNLVAEAVAVLRLNDLPCVLATWMPNGDLSRVLARQTKMQKLEHLLRIVRGLSWVHSKLGVIHRDLKPSNILLDEKNLAYVADWGLARPMGAMLTGDSKPSIEVLSRDNRTQLGSFLGTVSYAAPEQIMGSPSIDHRADIYALGCMMFEFETGSPPFQGATVSEIANQHLTCMPQKLGGWFATTELGLERVIARCLEKKPENRYPGYEALEKDLLPIAIKHGVLIPRIELRLQYQRTVLGQGQREQRELFLNVPAENCGRDGYRVVETDDVMPYLNEAHDLIALARYEEAEKIYRSYVHPEMICNWTQWWGLEHVVAVNYGFCLNRLGRAKEAEKLFTAMLGNKFKPAEFYVNYSMTLNELSKYRESTDVCREGLERFANDIDIQGNLTNAWLALGEYEQAFSSAAKRLNARRDIQSLDEAANVLLSFAKAVCYQDLPQAIELAKKAGDLIAEGLSLNPNYHTLQIREIFLRRLIHDNEAVNTLAPNLWRSGSVPINFREYAITEMLEHWAENGYGPDAGIEAAQLFLKNHPNWLNSIPALQILDRRIKVRFKLIRKENTSDEPVDVDEISKEVFGKSPANGLADPLLAAELKHWLGGHNEALAILDSYLDEAPADVDALRAKALTLSDLKQFSGALTTAEALVEIAPWRAESFDCLAAIAKKLGDSRLEIEARTKADKIFSDEMKLYDEAKIYLDRKLGA